MKKRSTKKIELSRETLFRLSSPDLQAAQGGAETFHCVSNPFKCFHTLEVNCSGI